MYLATTSSEEDGKGGKKKLRKVAFCSHQVSITSIKCYINDNQFFKQDHIVCSHENFIFSQTGMKSGIKVGKASYACLIQWWIFDALGLFLSKRS